MKGTSIYTLQTLAEVSGSELVGDANCRIKGIDVLQRAAPGQISFLANPDYRKFLKETRASAVILKPEDQADCPSSALVSNNPYLAYARISHLFASESGITGIHPSAVVASSAEIDASASIGPHCIIADNVCIGAETRLLGNNYVGEDVIIGRNCLIHAGAVIGSDGFGLANDAGTWVKIAQIGTVRLGDDVEVGANSTVDRGAIRDTIIGDGVKIDNQVQVAHNVEIGEHSVIAGCTGIAGSAKIGKRCMLGGGVGIQGHIELADDAVISGMAKVTRSLSAPGAYTGGIPAMPHAVWQKNIARFKKLDELAKKVQKLQKQIVDLMDNPDRD